MKCRILGTGSILCSEMSACALVDERILIDVPNGVTKWMRKLKVDIKKIDVCIVTHFHGDHCFDIPFLLMEQGLRYERKTPLRIMGPKGIKQRVHDLLYLAYPESLAKILHQTKVEFLELDDGCCVNNVPEGYCITSFLMDHKDCETYGVTISDIFGKNLGYTSDTRYCDSVESIAQDCSTVIMDMAFPVSKSGHMGVEDVLNLTKKYPTVTIIATHMSSDARNARPAGIIIPQDGDEYEL